uniref:Splicing factor putative n=1 Tax=Albugo laibachii Nc14 TaxID=890382 RepID=F0WQV0_9STRA|nr:splicing factor putative [Albugo laibachii Nc14]|eukprot:CCA23709.1 splicing factor putative [Albugo laibachii Nc14]
MRRKPKPSVYYSHPSLSIHSIPTMPKIFVGNLPQEISEPELEKTFGEFGKIVNVILKFPRRPPPFAFIEYEDLRDAEDAVQQMHGKELHGAEIRVEISRNGPKASRDEKFGGRHHGTQFRVELSNIPRSVSWQDLKDFLRIGGVVVHADVDRRGNGVASFTNQQEMERAIRKLKDAKLNGERIKIRQERDRPTSRSRSVSRSRSSSRSPSRSDRRDRRRRRYSPSIQDAFSHA